MSISHIPNSERGHVVAGWLRSAHAFSFGRYVNPARTGFGALLVVNEDVIAPGQGFGEHVHSNMEIITIMLSGAVRHGGTLADGSVVQAGEVQVMSAGTAVAHSEMNASATEPAHLLQIWIHPRERNLAPRYDHKIFGWDETKTGLVEVANGNTDSGALRIMQDASVSFGALEAGSWFAVPATAEGRGVFLLALDGGIRVGETVLAAGDMLEITNTPAMKGNAVSAGRLLMIAVPM